MPRSAGSAADIELQFLGFGVDELVRWGVGSGAGSGGVACSFLRWFFVPVLTHLTKPAERSKILEEFRKGSITVISTSKVLNEGVDVPEASVGVVLSGSGTVREHVQRLGRILRHKEGKSAVLYEIISKGTNETYVNQRRRQHYAYQGSFTSHRA